MRREAWYAKVERSQSPPSFRDAEECAAITAALKALPADHPARQAYAEGADTIRLTHLVADDPELVEALKNAFLAGYRRLLGRTGRHFRP